MKTPVCHRLVSEAEYSGLFIGRSLTGSPLGPKPPGPPLGPILPCWKTQCQSPLRPFFAGNVNLPNIGSLAYDFSFGAFKSLGTFFSSIALETSDQRVPPVTKAFLLSVGRTNRLTVFPMIPTTPGLPRKPGRPWKKHPHAVRQSDSGFEGRESERTYRDVKVTYSVSY